MRGGKQMKKIVSIVFSLLLTASLICFADAANEYIFDNYGYLRETDLLNDAAEETAEKTGFIVSCAITDSVDGTNGNEQAQRFFEEKFGDREGMILLDCVDTKQYYLYFSRAINDRLTQSDAEALFSAYDTQNDYDSSVGAFLAAAKEILLPLTEKDSAADSILPENESVSRIADHASVLSKTDLDKLNAYADSISAQYSFDVTAVFVNSTAPKEAQDYADDYYDSNGLGCGENSDGILLLIAVKDRKYAISTCGYGITAFSDDDLDALIGRFSAYLSSGNWSDAALEFITGCGEVLYRRAYEPQENAVSPYQSRISPFYMVLINIGVGLTIGFIIVASMKSKHKSVRKQTQAFSYLRDGSFKLTYSNDRFVNSTLNRTKKPQPQNRSSGHGGGSGASVHISSSGRTHGGKSGGF